MELGTIALQILSGALSGITRQMKEIDLVRFCIIIGGARERSRKPGVAGVVIHILRSTCLLYTSDAADE